MTKSKVANGVAAKRFQSIWRSLLWRGVVYGIPVGFVVGATVGVLVAVLERPDLVKLVGAMVGTVIYVPIALIITSMVVKKGYGSLNKRRVPHARAA